MTKQKGFLPFLFETLFVLPLEQAEQVQGASGALQGARAKFERAFEQRSNKTLAVVTVLMLIVFLIIYYGLLK